MHLLLRVMQKNISLEELKEAEIKVGVPMSTPIDDCSLQENTQELYLDNRRIKRGG